MCMFAVVAVSVPHTPNASVCVQQICNVGSVRPQKLNAIDSFDWVEK